MAEKQNQFAGLLDKKPEPLAPAPPRAAGGGRGRHIGGYFDPAVARQIKALAAEEDTTVQELVAEALDMLFEARGKAAIARQ